MADNPLKIARWSRTPGLIELDAAQPLDEEEPVLGQIEQYGITRGQAGEKLRKAWRSLVRTFHNLKRKETLFDHHPVWVPLINLYVPGAGKAEFTYKRSENDEYGSELKIFGSGFGGSLSAQMSETQSFNAEEGVSKSFQRRILVTVTRWASDDEESVVCLDPELPPGAPEYRLVNLPQQIAPTSLDSLEWQILHRVHLPKDGRGIYTWERTKISEANWDIDAGLPLPETLGIKLDWTLKVTRAEDFSVKYQISDDGNQYIFYQPANETMLAPFCAVAAGSM